MRYALKMGEEMFVRQVEIKRWRGKTTRSVKFCAKRGDAILFDKELGDAWCKAMALVGECSLVQVMQ